MRKLTLSILSLAACISLNAQNALSLITENPDRAANNMHSYEFAEIHDTPAPKGYKPFYITHYGRHGSRYEQNATFGAAAIKTLAHLDTMGLLTSQGKLLLEQIRTVQDAHVGMEGMLTPRGANEHRQIAARMADRYPEVFKSKERDQVNCVASTSQRCIVSMTNFTYSLKEKYPKQNFTFSTGEKFMQYINPSLRVYAPGNEPPQRPGAGAAGPMPPMAWPMARPVDPPYAPAPGVPGYDFTRFLKPLLTDFNRAMAEIGNPEPFIKAAFSAGGMCQDVDFLGIDIFGNYFTPEELEYLWASGNDSIYRMWAASLEVGDNIKYAARPLLKDFMDKADEAIQAGSRRSADLRFGHDTAILPLFALLGVDDLEGRRFLTAEAHKNGWYAFEQIPMGTNCQMIFYRNKSGNVLAKILYNEKEVCLPGLEPAAGPYYEWTELRAYFQDLYDWKAEAVKPVSKPKPQVTAPGNLLDAAAFNTEIDGKKVSLYTITNGTITAQITNYGGYIVGIYTPDKDGNYANVVGHNDNIQDYMGFSRNPAGPALGRYANRIGNAKFTLDGVEYNVTKNNGQHILHGGSKAFDHTVWDVLDVSQDKVVLSCTLEDGLDGFPGNMTTILTFSVTEDNGVSIDFKATTDKTTVCSLSHHAYFNLNGTDSDDILNHVITINSDKITESDATLIPTGKFLPVEGTLFDFRKPVKLGDRQVAPAPMPAMPMGPRPAGPGAGARPGQGAGPAARPQMPPVPDGMVRSYDQNFCLNHSEAGKVELVAVLSSPETGRVMEVLNDHPGMQLFTGNRRAIAMESQMYPDSPNHPEFPSTTLRPGETYTHTVVYRFKTE